jgi:DNA polymerase III epsilon subunit family exonuclease
VETALRPSFDDPATPLSMVTFVVVDVETTGGSPATCSLTEVAAARYRGGELLGTYRTFVRPDERIPPFITALTGISDAMVADAPRIGAMLPSFLEFVGGAVLVGHNVRFDKSFLDHALVSTGRSPLANATVDTLALSRRLVRDMVPNCQLGTLAAVLRLPHQPSHRALHDVLATGDLLHAMIERAGSFGIFVLGELLDLPRLVGHPHAGKLRLTTRLPQRCGVYWLTDAAGNVLAVGQASDLRARVRAYFTGERSRSVDRLLRQLHAVGYRPCPGPLTAAVMEGRLTRSWSPPFDDQGRTRTRHRAVRSSGVKSDPPPERRRWRRPEWSTEELAGDPMELLVPVAGELAELRRQLRFEEAASVRDRAERLCRQLIEHRRVASLRHAGRVVLLVEGEGMVELEDGLVVGGPEAASGPAHRGGGGGEIDDALAGDGDHQERIIVAQWLEAHADRVRVLEAGADQGLSMPAARIPRLTELCQVVPTREAMVGSEASVVQFA